MIQQGDRGEATALGMDPQEAINEGDVPEILPDSPDGMSSSGEASSSLNDMQYPPDVKYGFDELCPVCGDKVSGYHYGLLTCESCKGFFKRTVQNKKVYSCVDNRSCHIDKSQRKRCPFCRFQKCLSVGMKLEAVRSDRMRGGRNKFGPMYKRDRALKQQAVRQQQQILAQYSLHLPNGGSPVRQNGLEDVKPDPTVLLHSSDLLHNSEIPYTTSNSSHVATSPVCATTTNMTYSQTSGSVSHHSMPSMISPQGQYVLPQDYSQKINSMQPYYGGQSAPVHMPVVPQLIKDMKSSSMDENTVKQKLVAFMQSEFGVVDLQSQTSKMLQILCKMADQLLFLMVEWARNSVFFKELKVEDQMTLLQNCWSEILILDFVQRRAQNNWPQEVTLNNGQKLGMDCLDRLGLSDVRDRINDLVRKIKELKIDNNEYICLKFLVLLNPDVSSVEHRLAIEQSQEKINAALLEYCMNFYPNIKDKFGQILLRLPEIRVISLRAEEYLYFRHVNGDIPDQTLLMEMLHSKRK